MNRYTQLIEEIQAKWFVLVVALLPFPQVFVRWAILIWFGLWILEGRWLHRPVSLKQNRIAIPVLMFGAWYVLKLVSGLWVEDRAAWAFYLESHATFAAMIPIGIWGVNERYDWHKVLNALILGCVAVAILYPFTMFWVYNHEYFVPLAHTGELHALDMAWYADKISYIKHRLFLCSIEVGGLVAVGVCHKSWQQKYGKAMAWGMSICAIACMLATIWTTGSRQTLFTLPVLLCIILCIQLKRQQGLRYGIGGIAMIALLSILVYQMHPRKDEFDTKELTAFRTPDMSHDIRLNIWAFTIATPKDYLVHGLGAGQTTNYLRAKYEEAHWDWYLTQGYNACHNQYLTELVENGIIGLIWFVLCWIALLYYSYGTPMWLASVSLTVIYSMNMLTDDMMSRYDSIALWSVWIVLLLVLSRGEAYGKTNDQPSGDAE